MPTIGELIAENANLRKTVGAQGVMIQQQREAIKRVRATKIALVAGRFAAEVDPTAEANRAKEFITPPIESFARMLTVLEHYSKGKGGEMARDYLTSIGR